jgi:hypothetical protein
MTCNYSVQLKRYNNNNNNNNNNIITGGFLCTVSLFLFSHSYEDFLKPTIENRELRDGAASNTSANKVMTFIVPNSIFIVICRYHGNKERQEMRVIIWPRAHKSLYAASSHIQKQRTSPSHTTRNSTSSYFQPQWECCNCTEIRRDTSGKQKRWYDFQFFSFVSENLVSLSWLIDILKWQYINQVHSFALLLCTAVHDLWSQTDYLIPGATLGHKYDINISTTDMGYGFIIFRSLKKKGKKGKKKAGGHLKRFLLHLQ